MMIQQCARKNCKAKRAGVYLMSCAVLDCSWCDGVRPGHRVKQSAVYRHLMTPSWAILLITSHVPNA